MASSERGDVYTLELAEEHVANANGNIDRISEALTQDDTDLTPNTPAAGSIQYSASGQQKYVSADGNAYNTGRVTIGATGVTNLTTSMQTISGLSANLGVGTYRVHAQLLYSVPVTSGQGALTFRLHPTGGLTAANGRCSVTEVFATNGVGLAGFDVLDTTFTGSTPGTSGANRIITFDGYFVVTVAGTINVQGAQAASALVSCVQYGTYLEVYPVS